MPREDWRDRDDERLRRRHESDRGDFGQADYSNLYGYDPRTRTGYRAYDDGRHPFDRDREEAERERADDGGERPYFEREREGDWERRRAQRGGPSDRVLWAIIMERLDDERRLDLRHVEVDVRDGEVTLNGTVRHKADKRRIEDVADIEGVRNVQNNLRVREHGRWTFL